MIHLKLFSISRHLAVLCALALCGVPAYAADYQLTDISPAADHPWTYPAAVNNEGQIAGTSGDVAFHYLNGMKETLGSLLGGKTSSAFSINNLGDVVGDSTFNDSGIRHATFFAKGEAVDLGTFAWSGAGDYYSVARGVNDHREVVGYVGPDASSHAFIFDEISGMRALGSLGGEFSQAFAISNSHFITGNSQLENGSDVRHAFLSQPKQAMRDLGTLGKPNIQGVDYEISSYGTFVNDLGHVVGYSELDTMTKRVHAFLYDGKTMHDLGSLGPKATESDSSMALGINNQGFVVGTTYQNYYGGSKLVQIAFLYRDGVMYDLNILADVSSTPYRLQSATAINDAGQIVVQAVNLKTNEMRAVLLTPNVSQSPVRAATRASKR